jgi:cysteine desulfurase
MPIEIKKSSKGKKDKNQMKKKPVLEKSKKLIGGKEKPPIEKSSKVITQKDKNKNKDNDKDKDKDKDKDNDKNNDNDNDKDKSTKLIKQKNKDCIYLDNVNTSLLGSKVEQVYKKNIHDRVPSQTDRDKIINESKEYLLKMCEAPSDKYSVFYTSGEIESNHIILCCAVNAYKKIRKIKPHVVISTVEHNSIIMHAKSLLDSDQIELSIIKPNSYGCILSDTVAKSLKPNTCFVSITYINRELGSVNNIEKISSILHEKKIPLHCDCTYLFGKHKLDLTKTNIDTATISFDKINGPVGIGALIINNDLYNGYKLYEHSTTLAGDRPQNIPCIVSAITSFKISSTNRKVKNELILKFRNEIINRLSDKCQTMTFANFMNSDAPPLDDGIKSKNKIVILGPPANNESYYTPSILSIVIISEKNKTGQDIKKELEKKCIIIGVPDIEKNVMYADIGMPPESLKYIIRISLSDDITQENIDKFIDTLKSII